MFRVLRRACGAVECMEWSIFGFAALNLPTCHWLGCSRALNPRGSESSTALVDEPGSDGQKHRELRRNALSATLYEELRSSSDTTGGADSSVRGTP